MYLNVLKDSTSRILSPESFEKFSVSANFGEIYSGVVTMEFAMKFETIFDKEITFHAFFS